MKHWASDDGISGRLGNVFRNNGISDIDSLNKFINNPAMVANTYNLGKVTMREIMAICTCLIPDFDANEFAKKCGKVNVVFNALVDKPRGVKNCVQCLSSSKLEWQPIETAPYLIDIYVCRFVPAQDLKLAHWVYWEHIIENDFSGKRFDATHWCPIVLPETWPNGDAS